MFPDPVETDNCTCPLTFSVRSNVASEASAVLAASPNAAAASNSFFIECLVSHECVPRNQGNADQIQKITALKLRRRPAGLSSTRPDGQASSPRPSFHTFDTDARFPVAKRCRDILVPNPYSLFPVPCSLSTVHCLLSTVH